jgi:hypothetical protein
MRVYQPGEVPAESFVFVTLSMIPLMPSDVIDWS